MNTKNLVGLFVLAVMLLVVPSLASAYTFADIEYVTINSINLIEGTRFTAEAGDTLDLSVALHSYANQDNVRVTARVVGEPGLYESTDRFDVIANQLYSKHIQLKLPKDINPDETFILEVRVESQSEVSEVQTSYLIIQRKNYALDFLSIESPSRISAGDVLPIEVVVENTGRHTAEDTFVIANIPALGISKRIFLEDLSAVESLNQDNEEDALAGRILLAIPAGTTPGVYSVEIKAFNDDSETTSVRQVEILSSSSNSAIVSSPSSRTFSVGSDGQYTLTIVNSGNRILVYNIVTESDNGLTVDTDSVVVVPAGSSKSIDLTANSNREGNYNFKVTVLDADNNVVAEKSFVANVEGRTVGGNAAVVLTIILAIVFVVLLVVLIVLLTRKPAKADESGESYY